MSQPRDDDLEELRRLKDEALASSTGDPLVDAYTRGSIEMSFAEVSGEPITASYVAEEVICRCGNRFAVYSPPLGAVAFEVSCRCGYITKRFSA